MAKGWTNESMRHSLSAQGIKTTQKTPQRKTMRSAFSNLSKSLEQSAEAFDKRMNEKLGYDTEELEEKKTIPYPKDFEVDPTVKESPAQIETDYAKASKLSVKQRVEYAKLAIKEADLAREELRKTSPSQKEIEFHKSEARMYSKLARKGGLVVLK